MRNLQQHRIAHRLPGPEQLFVAGASMAFAALLLWSYLSITSERWGYLGYTQAEALDELSIAFGFTLVAVGAFLLPLRAWRPGSIIVWFLYAVVLVSVEVILPAVGNLDRITVLKVQSAVFIAFVALALTDRMPLLRIPSPVRSPRWFWLGILACSVATYAILISAVGLPVSLPSLAEIYTVRAEYRDAMESTSLPVPYLMIWQAKVINPVLIAVALSNGKPSGRLLAGFTGVVGQLWIFAETGWRSVLFSIALVVILTLLIRWFPTLVGMISVTGLVALVCGSLFVYVAIDLVSPFSIFVRRLLMTPGMMTGIYVEYFSTHPKALLGNSLLSAFVEYPYDTSIPFVVGRDYLGRPSTSANANLWADGFAHFGFVGIAVTTAMLAGIIWVLNALARTRDLIVIASVAGLAGYTVSESSLFTGLLTHGIGAALIVLFLYPERNAGGMTSDGGQCP